MLVQLFKKIGKAPGVPLLLLTSKAFVKNAGFDKAATLTFYTLLSLVPLIALSLGIAEIFGFEQGFIDQVYTALGSQPEVAEKIMEFGVLALQQTKGRSWIAVVALLLIIWTAFKMITTIAATFNEIWHLRKHRSWKKKLVAFLPLLFLFPAFLAGASGLIIFLNLEVLKLTHREEILYLLECVPFFLISSFLSFIYIYLPNTKVSWKVGICAGVVTAILYLCWQWIYVTFQLKASSYGAIYGSLAALPLFLIWLNYSWLIVLFGNQLAFEIESKKNRSL